MLLHKEYPRFLNAGNPSNFSSLITWVSVFCTEMDDVYGFKVSPFSMHNYKWKYSIKPLKENKESCSQSIIPVGCKLVLICQMISQFSESLHSSRSKIFVTFCYNAWIFLQSKTSLKKLYNISIISLSKEVSLVTSDYNFVFFRMLSR